jgi:hypothetical protein
MVHADGEYRDPRPRRRHDQRCGPRFEGDREALKRRPAECPQREEERHCGCERRRDLDREPAELRSSLHGRELEILPDEERQLMGKLARKRLPSGLRLDRFSDAHCASKASPAATHRPQGQVFASLNKAPPVR